MNQIWQYMDQELNPQELPTMEELISEIDANGGTDAALAGLREKQYEKHGCELIWRYPISQGDSAGGFLMPVREGILWIPYDEMEKDAGEVLRTSDAVLMDEEACRCYAEDFMCYAKGLCDVLKQSTRICRRIRRASEEDVLIDLGSFEMVSERMAVSDPCYDTDVWCRGELNNALPGPWKAYVAKRNEGKDWGMRVARLVAVHQDYADEVVPKMTIAPFEVGVDSGQAGVFDVKHYRDDNVILDNLPAKRKDAGIHWYMNCCCMTTTQTAAGVIPFGVVASSGYGDGSYDCFYAQNSDGKIIRVEIEFIPKEEDDE